MSEQAKTLVPKLRFPEFQDAEAWEEVKLGQLGALVSGLTYSPEDIRDSGLLVLRSSNVQNGEITLDDNVYVKPNIRGANLTKPNDILICVRNGSKALIGKNALIPEGMPLCTHGAFMTVFRSPSAKFVFQLFQTLSYQKHVDGDLGATINSINGSQFIKYKFYVPKPLEQQKIADCLSSLDELITAQTNKIAALKDHKKGLMQQLFPAEGETVPKLRFPEFQDAGEWEETRLGNVGSVRMCKRIFKEQTSSHGDIPFYKIGTFGGAPDAFISREIFENYRNNFPFPKKGSVLISAAGTIGRTILYKGELAYFQDSNIVWLDNNENLIADIFLFYLYQLINWAPSVGAIQRLYNESILGAQVKFPSIPEQQRIADCLSSIDELINAQTQKLETYKTHKKGLMQQLFPIADKVRE